MIFETGYGPSGLPHIGTFGEVARTTMVRHAFEVLTEGKRKTRLICFSDDMDGLRKVPDNVPNKDMLAAHLGKPLTSVPDPFSNEYPSFAAHNNARLRRFLDQFGFEYEFLSATECYKAGRFDATLLKMLEVYDKVMDIILPTLGPERRATYSPFLPISPTLGQGAAGADGGARRQEGHHRLHRSRHRQEGRDAGDGRARQVPVEGRLGHALDRARRRLRDVRQGPDRLGDAVVEDLPGARRHAAGELHLRAVPRRGGRQDLQVEGQRPHHRGVADLRLAREPVAVHVPEAEGGQEAVLRRDPAHGGRIPAVPRRLSAPGCRRRKLDNAVWHIHAGAPPAAELPITFGLLLNLVAASNAHDKDVLWGFIRRHAPDAGPETHPLLDQLAGYAVRYYEDFVKPQKKFRLPTRWRSRRCGRCRMRSPRPDRTPRPRSCKASSTMSGARIPRYQDPNAKGATPDKPGVSNAWFGAIYQVLLGEERGPALRQLHRAVRRGEYAGVDWEGVEGGVGGGVR